MVRKFNWALLVGLLLAAARVFAASDSAGGVPWSALSPVEQKMLERMHGQWDSLPPARQQALERGAARWLAMTPAERQGAKQRFKRWQNLSPGDRELIRDR